MNTHYTIHDYQTVEEQHMHTVPFINKVIREGHAADMILVTEAIQEKRLVEIAERIAASPTTKIILIAGPSSSGKTSTSKRLCIQLMACRRHPVALSTDNWFVNREHTPLDEEGKLDFESIYAMDLDQFNQDMTCLIAGEEVALPTFNFVTGQREYRGDSLRLTPDMLLVIEGIHALNPLMTQSLPADSKFRIFAAPMSPISLDGTNWIPTTVNRLLRRISRDNQTRGISALETIRRWPSVRRGEERWIIPFQGEADEQFDTSMLYELAALRPKAEPVLAAAATAPSPALPRDGEGAVDTEVGEAVQRLLQFLRCFEPIDEAQVPRNSLMREFIGGSFFNVG